MKNSPARILLLLASSDVGRDELRAFSRWVLDEHPDELGRRVQEIRAHAEKGSSASSRPVSVSKQNDHLREEVEQLLVSKIGMKRVEVASLLREKMIQEGRLNPSFLPWNSGSFGQWLNKLAKTTSPSDVLHFASRISRDLGTSCASAWPLKSRDGDA